VLQIEGQCADLIVNFKGVDLCAHIKSTSVVHFPRRLTTLSLATASRSC